MKEKCLLCKNQITDEDLSDIYGEVEIKLYKKWRDEREKDETAKIVPMPCCKREVCDEEVYQWAIKEGIKNKYGSTFILLKRIGKWMLPECRNCKTPCNASTFEKLFTPEFPNIFQKFCSKCGENAENLSTNPYCKVHKICEKCKEDKNVNCHICERIYHDVDKDEEWQCSCCNKYVPFKTTLALKCIHRVCRECGNKNACICTGCKNRLNPNNAIPIIPVFLYFI